MKRQFTFSKEMVALSVLVQSTNVVAAEFEHSRICDLELNPDLRQTVISKIQTVHNVNIDWQEFIQVSDDEEGFNCLFSTNSGVTISIPIEAAALTAPNKFVQPE